MGEGRGCGGMDKGRGVRRGEGGSGWMGRIGESTVG